MCHGNHVRVYYCCSGIEWKTANRGFTAPSCSMVH